MRILNKYTHEWMLAPCGHCEACQLTKSSRMKLQVSLETASHPYIIFVTLTFSDDYVPRVSVFDSTDENGIPCSDFYDINSGELVCRCYLRDSEKDQLSVVQSKVQSEFIPYLRKDLLQKFIKRLRKYIYGKTKKKIRYYAVGEYGPVHLRPHYHLSIFADSYDVVKEMDAAVSACWSFGRCSAELPTKDPTRYLTSYLNNFSALPEIFKERSFCPFSLHSQFLGQKLLLGEREKVYSSTFSDFIQRSLPVGNSVTEFNLWRQAYSVYFPKCKGFACKTSSERDYSYRILQKAIKYYPTCSDTISMARCIAADIVIFDAIKNSDDSEFVKFLHFFYDSEFVNNSINDDRYQKYIMSIYTQLLCSKHFLYFCCRHQTITEMIYKRKLIEQFYNKLDYYNLTKWFDSQRVYFDSDMSDSDDIIFFYDNHYYDSKLYYELPIAKRFYTTSKTEYINRNKHKKLNDLNRLLFNN